MRLSDLMEMAGEGATLAPNPDNADPVIDGLTSDSRDVKPGTLFAALPGATTDGRAYIPQAIKSGAVAILLPASPGLDLSNLHEPSHPHVRFIVDENPRRRFALFAAHYHGGQPPLVAAVTGTNGKTSVCAFTRQIWTMLGRKGASLGTLGVSAPDFERPGSLTTPDSMGLHRILADLSGRGVDCLAMEASSHGLAQYRLDGVNVKIAAMTNISRDHLDYHGSMESYQAAKTRLFTEVLSRGGTAILNADIPGFRALNEACRVKNHIVFSYGRLGEDIRLIDLIPTVSGQKMTFAVELEEFTVTLPLAGAFQAENVLCALGVALASGAKPKEAVACLSRLEGVPGRMQKVADSGGGAAIYVDYAHTPDALETVLSALRPHAKGMLGVVFGCGGDRDKGKRPLMGDIACRLADKVIITDDNPRSEDAATIRSEIKAACPRALEIGDRAAAIRSGVADLRPGDILLLAGKGHERGQIVGDETFPFDDAEEARKALAELAA